MNTLRFGSAAVHRLRTALWPITQTSVAAGLAWYITHDVLHHRQPFFAPISAVVCMSATNVLRSRRAVQMIVGVTLGIVLGAAVHGLHGSVSIAMGLAVFVSLCVALLLGRGFIAQGLMFVNQTAVSAVLVLAFTPSGEIVAERLFDAFVGGGLALVFAILLFPADPRVMLRNARSAVLTGVHDTLIEVARMAENREPVAPEWPLSVFERMHNEVGGLIEARETADLVVRRTPRWWGARRTIRTVNQQSARLGMLVSGVLHVARAVTWRLNGPVPEPLRVALAELAAGTALADEDPAAASEHVAAARSEAVKMQESAQNRSQAVLADIVYACTEDLQRVIEVPSR